MTLTQVAPTTHRRLSRLWTPRTQHLARRALAQQESDARGDTKPAFELGWDFARHGLDAPEPLADHPDFLAGLRAGRHHWHTRRTEDRYTRKWLLLRASALARGVPFSAEVTPAYLAEIDAVLCPVTRQPLTRGTGAASDASVDRINNRCGYQPGNLVVMSVRANGAKAGMDSIDMLKVVHNLGSLPPGAAFHDLTIHEWARLATLTAYAESQPDFAIETWPLVVQPTPHMQLRSPAWRFKIDLTRQAIAGDSGGMPPAAVGAFESFAAAVAAARQHALLTASGLGHDVACRIAEEDLWRCAEVNARWAALLAAIKAARSAQGGRA